MTDYKPPFGQSWRGMDGEDLMTDADWNQRAFEQAKDMLEGGDGSMANPDKDGVETSGCYNGDYTQAQHDAANALLDDEYTEAEVDRNIRDLYHIHQDS
jgi:hypothetical protein